VRLSDVTVELRPREPNEAVDLGQLLWRRSWWSLQRAWFATFVPIALGLGVGFHEHPVVAVLVLWWLAPLFERAPLLVLGRLVFGSTTSLGELLAALPRLWTRRALWRLTIGRLSPWRAFVAPVAVLEQTSGRAARARGSALMSGGGEGTAALATAFTALAMQVALAVALYAAILMLSPPWLTEELDRALRAPFTGEVSATWPGVVFYAIACVAMSVVGPWHAACGFALYLNRRMYLEGWDVEVAFRALAERLASGARRGAALVLALAVFAAALVAPPVHASAVPAVSAQEQPVAGDTPGDAAGVGTGDASEGAARDPAALADEILARPEFDRTRTTRKRVDDDVPDGIDGFGFDRFLAPIAYSLLVVLGIVLVVGLFRLASRWRGTGGLGRRASGPPPPVEVAGLDVRPESLPADPASAALALWRRGDARAALGLLYRAAIARLAREHLVPIADGDTEERCLERVLAVGERAPGRVFTALTRAWQGCAWGRVLPTAGEFEDLCRDFGRAFGGEPEGGAA
jgi:hypothetical protein